MTIAVQQYVITVWRDDAYLVRLTTLLCNSLARRMHCYLTAVARPTHSSCSESTGHCSYT